MDVGKNVLEVTEEKCLRSFGHVKRISGNRLPRRILQWEPEGARWKGRPKERWMDGVTRSTTERRLTESDTIDRDRWGTLLGGEGRQMHGG
jgi:hypothetical protein